jgi:hypothetical protein
VAEHIFELDFKARSMELTSSVALAVRVYDGWTDDVDDVDVTSGCATFCGAWINEVVHFYTC